MRLLSQGLPHQLCTLNLSSNSINYICDPLWEKVHFRAIINPRRAWAERVTVVVLCVCIYVCHAHAILAVRTIKSVTKDTVVLNVRFAAIL